MAIERQDDFLKDRIVEPTISNSDSEEAKIEISLRPTNFKEYIGQERLKNNLKLAIDAVKRGEKVINFKRKRRKGYRRTVGHRQQLTVATVKAIA